MKNKIIIFLVLIPTIFIFSSSPVFALTPSDYSFPTYDSTSFSIGPLLPNSSTDSFSDSFKDFISDCIYNPENVYVKADFNGYSRFYIYYFDKKPSKSNFTLFTNKTVNYLSTSGLNIKYVYFDITTGLAQCLNPIKLTDTRIYFPGINTPQIIFDFSFFYAIGFSANEFTSRIPSFSYNNPSVSLKLNFQGFISPPVSSEPEPLPSSSEPSSSEPSSEPEPPPSSSEPSSEPELPPVSSEPTPPSVNTDLLGFTPSVFNKSSDTLRVSIGNGVNIGFIVMLSVLSILVAIRIIRHLLE